MTEIQQKIVDEELEIDKQVNLMDQFIADGEFDKALNEFFGLPESPEESCKGLP
ncbi:hypothetical protein [Acinetobacter sp. RF14B]|uniref:hypothetical protein n=1 Tax=Acinetobacter sp. RF14B TaxID=2650965 RepID=UPI00148EEA7B|nr:hypothetical protein [Acinetobacter sp. RF14B]